VFLKNAWYVAASDAEVTRALRAVTILGERIVLYRTEAGLPVALEDACAHRKLPLSMGRLKGDEVECGYHGMVYDCAGRCTRVPGTDRIPTAARVRRYPSASRDGLVWVWMGDEAIADPAKIFEVVHATDPGWGRNRGGSMTVACNYRYVNDNLLDPSHVAWVHRSSFGNDACADTPVETTERPDGVIAARWMRDVEVAPFYRALVRFEGRCDRLQHYEVRYPSHAFIRAVFVPAGAADAEGVAHPLAMIMDSYNFMTPVDEHTTRYFWFQTRNFAPGDGELDRATDDAVQAAFAEDKLVLEAVYAGFRQQRTPKLDLAIDRAQLLFRRRLDSRILLESAPAP
jgi:vanillate O-demethylase monooxygenase subunit